MALMYWDKWHLCIGAINSYQDLQVIQNAENQWLWIVLNPKWDIYNNLYTYSSGNMCEEAESF